MSRRMFDGIGLMVLGLVWANGCGNQTTGAGGPSGQTVYSQQYRQQVFIASEHPYESNTLKEWEIRAPEGTLRFKVHFSRFETERYYDQVFLLDRNGNRLFRLSGDHSGEEFWVQGDYVKIRFVSDGSVTAWGFNIDYYTYVVEEDHPVDHRPYCGAVGSRSEGWYWGDTGELIKYASCAGAGEPRCVGIGSRSEGWTAEGAGLIVWDNCHRTIRIALAGEACGPSIGFSCYDGLYCEGLPGDGRLGGTGTCRSFGYCDSDDDCSAEGNAWDHDGCEGFALCDTAQHQCSWRCRADQDGPWSWSHHLVQGIESEHPYRNNYTHTWTIHEPGASKIRVTFSKIDLERGYDWIAVAANGQAPVYYDGYRENFTTRDFDGDTLAITIHTDQSVTKWGFKVVEVEFYEQLGSGMCNVDADCGPVGVCKPNRCFNPYAPCYGQCGRDDHCDEGMLSCRRVIPECPTGLIPAIKNGCYECVDPDTCTVPSTDGQEGDRCDSEHPCGEGLFCKHMVDGVGTCQGELWCDAETVNADCSNVVHIMVPGTWACNEHHCAWQTGLAQQDVTAQDTPMAIPDNDPQGVTSTIQVSGMKAVCLDPQVAVDLTIRHTYRSDLRVVLEDPNGNQVVLANRSGGSADDLILSGFGVGGVGGQGLNGAWHLHVSDLAALDVGTIEAWTMHLSCR